MEAGNLQDDLEPQLSERAKVRRARGEVVLVEKEAQKGNSGKGRERERESTRLVGSVRNTYRHWESGTDSGEAATEHHWTAQWTAVPCS